MNNFFDLFFAVTKENSSSLNKIEQFLQSNSINTIDNNGYTLLLCAINLFMNDLISWLVKRGADINGNRKAAYYPLEEAALVGNYEAVKFLNKTNCLKFGRSSDCSLVYSTAKGNIEIVEFLLRKGVDANKIWYNGMLPIHWAAQEGYLEIVKLLVENGANINVVDEDDQTPLYIATGENHRNIVEYLISKHVIVDYERHTTPFMIACAYEHYEAADILLKSGANIDHKDNEGRTALFYAFVKKQDKMIKFLLKKGASSNIVDSNGVSIKDLSQEALRAKLYDELF